MVRKLAPALALAAALPALVGAEAPPVRVARCPGADLTRAMPAIVALRRDPGTRALLVLVDGCPALTAYAPGYSDANRIISWSMAKTVTAMLVGVLVSDGRLSLDAPAPIAEWRRPGEPRGRITLRDLLQMRSGLRHTEVGNPIENSDTNQALFVHGTNAVAAYAIGQPLEAAPGTRYEYSSLTTVILSEIVTRTLTPSRDPRVRARAYRGFAQARLFGPAGVTSAVLEFDGAGTQIGGSIIRMTLADWGRMGLLLLDGRNAEGQEVIAPAWLAVMKAPSPTNAEYGGQTWLNRPSGVEAKNAMFPSAAPTVAAMRGHLGQLVVADPAGQGRRGTVVVRLGHNPDAALGPVFRDMDALVAALEKNPAR